MIRKHLTENTFVTFNGLYGKWSENSIALFADQIPTTPWRTMPDLFTLFPKHFYDNLKFLIQLVLC